MSDSRYVSATLNLLRSNMKELAQKIGAMDLDDPQRSDLIRELSDLTELSESWQAKRDKSIYQKMDELAREMITFKPGDLRRARMVSEILGLSNLLKPT